MPGFLDALEDELRSAADAQWGSRRPRRGRRMMVTAVAVAAVVAIGATVLLVTPADRRKSDPARAATTTYVDRVHGFAVTYPRDWRRATRRLTPVLLDPREILSVGDGPLAVQRPAADCPQLPTRALAALGEGQALVTIQERRRGSTGGDAGLPVRWNRLGRLMIDCVPAGVDGRWFVFTSAGRTFNTLIAVGPGSKAAVGRRAIAVVNSFRARPRR